MLLNKNRRMTSNVSGRWSNLKYDHPVLIKIHKLHSQLIQEERGIGFVWVPGHVCIRGNSAADSAAKDALDGDISDEFIPLPALKPRLNNISLSSGNVKGMNTPGTNYTRCCQNWRIASHLVV